jgi:hypothetical protein
MYPFIYKINFTPSTVVTSSSLYFSQSATRMASTSICGVNSILFLLMYIPLNRRRSRNGHFRWLAKCKTKPRQPIHKLRVNEFLNSLPPIIALFFHQVNNNFVGILLAKFPYVGLVLHLKHEEGKHIRTMFSWVCQHLSTCSH